MVATDSTGPSTFVIAQLGQSLDGRIATISGDSLGISGPAALDHLHALRADVDAVIVGASTILADNPRLTVRRTAGRSPARVVIDPSRRLGSQGRWLAADGARRLCVTAATHAPDGAELVQLPAKGGVIAPAAILAALAERGLRRILIEGGARTISVFIDAGCVDRLHVLMAPLIIGSGRAALNLEPVAELRRARRPKTSVWLLGDGDVLFDCDLRQSVGASRPPLC